MLVGLAKRACRFAPFGRDRKNVRSVGRWGTVLGAQVGLGCCLAAGEATAPRALSRRDGVGGDGSPGPVETFLTCGGGVYYAACLALRWMDT